MCGIAGIFDPSELAVGESRIPLESMLSSLKHRGPDDTGIWQSENNQIALGHTRLSILDLSEAGSQPMCSKTDRYVISFNGEIYNHLELRLKLRDSSHQEDWRGTSDTETLLTCIESWGVQKTLENVIGMFAFALWDKREQKLFLCRDRCGEKPLYYGWQNGQLIFASELKAFHDHPAFEKNISRNSVNLLLRYNYVPAPFSIYEGVFKLPPAHFIGFDALNRDKEPVAYWDILQFASEPGSRSHLSHKEVVTEFDQVLSDTISQQMLSDVPLGALLSGGIDSSLICAIMQTQSDHPINTFTIGFEDTIFNEAEYARKISDYLGTNHTEAKLSGSDCLEMVPRLSDIYDEPFADSSQLPTALVMKVASRNVKVALSGDGGDEVFGGYTRYTQVPGVWRKLRWMPENLRVLFAQLVTCVPASTINKLFLTSKSFTQLGDKLHRLGYSIDGIKGMDDLYMNLVSEWRDLKPVLGIFPMTGNQGLRVDMPTISEPASRMMVMDTLTYLPDDILVKVDRAAMYSSLETRAPFLDPRVMEFAWSLGIEHKISGNSGKRILQSLLSQYLPDDSFDRPKQGFAIPLDDWLRGPLSNWVEDMLSDQRLETQGYFNKNVISETWEKHKKGASLGYRLWSVIMFQSWLERW